jgi:uncharacterized phage protein (TIGR01671 family)
MMAVVSLSFWNNELSWVGIGTPGHETRNHDTDDPSAFIPMQYTGLHDRNGKEIYEGDVLRGELGSLYKVEFADGQFQPVLRYGGTQVVIESIADMANRSSVVGNMWENGDLLDNKNTETN